MRNVLWIDKNILQRYRRGWSPVSHPLILTGRRPFGDGNDIKGSPILNSEKREDDIRGREGSGEKRGRESSGDIGCKDDLTKDGKRNRKDDNRAEKFERETKNDKIELKLKDEVRIPNIFKVLINEDENKISNSTVDEARKRFLARKKAK